MSTVAPKPDLNACTRCACRLGSVNEPGDDRCAAEARDTEVKVYPRIGWMRGRAGPCGPGARLFRPHVAGLQHQLQ